MGPVIRGPGTLALIALMALKVSMAVALLVLLWKQRCISMSARKEDWGIHGPVCCHIIPFTRLIGCGAMRQSLGLVSARCRLGS
jgi:hypothetical protein